MTTQHIGAAGERLVQYRLLKLGIDSALLTTDVGVDLVVYSPTEGRAITVQVKTVREPTAKRSSRSHVSGTGRAAPLRYGPLRQRRSTPAAYRRL